MTVGWCCLLAAAAQCSVCVDSVIGPDYCTGSTMRIVHKYKEIDVLIGRAFHVQNRAQSR